MDLGNIRREQIVKMIKESESPLSGTSLAKSLNVSRQVIVTDVALIRAQGVDILSTHRGYVISNSLIKVIKVKHSNDCIEDELQTIVDLGGKVLDCFIEHDVYGKINVPLNINSRKDINDFLNNMKDKKNLPLMQITNDIHYHTITADSEDLLNCIETALSKYIIK